MVVGFLTSRVPTAVVACRGVMGLVIGLAVVGASARAAPPCAHDLVVPAVVQRGPTCAVAAVVMTARGLGVPLELGELAAAVPVWRDGVDFFDLEEALLARGLTSMTFRGDVALAARFVAVGLPVVVAVDLHGGKHAVTMVGFDGAVVGGQCTRELGPGRSIRVIDPWDGRVLRRDRAGLERLQFGRQLFVLWPRAAGWEERIARAGIDLQPLVAQDRRFRAEALVRRAKQHAAPNDQMLVLMERAVSEDPSWDEARALRDAVRERVRGAGQSP